MAYVLNALVVELAADPAFPGLQIVPLARGKGLIPLTDAFWTRGGHRSSQPILREWETRRAPDDDFDAADERAAYIEQALSAFAHISEICIALSIRGPVAYLEVNLFGGSGGQASAVWEQGRMTLGPLIAQDAINQALSKLGVARKSSCSTPTGLGDEFEMLGLGRHRFTGDWLPKE
jgi:hypothetical protein